MAANGVDRSVNYGGPATVTTTVTGDENIITVKDVKIQLPPPEQVNPANELAELRAMLESLNMSDSSSVDLKLALDMAEAEARKPEADKNWMGAAMERALKIAEGASDFGEKIEKIAPKVKALASWLGKNWHKLLVVVGVTV